MLAIARRGYIAHGVWVPEFILENPEVLRGVHEEFVHAGTDVVEAFQVNCIKSASIDHNFTSVFLVCSITLTARK